MEIRAITLRRIHVYGAICAHKRQENFERYAGMKGQKPLAGRGLTVKFADRIPPR